MIKKLSQIELKHGGLQVERMLKDRPAMAKHITKNDIIWKWAVKKFAGEDLSETIDWNKKTSRQGFQAENYYPLKKRRGFIRVNPAFEYLWVCSIRALHQIAKAPYLEHLYQLGYANCCKRDDWVNQCAELEYDTLIEIKKFYLTIWKPWARTSGFSSEPSLWSSFMNLPESLDEWKNLFSDQEISPWSYWGEIFDADLLPYLKGIQAKTNSKKECLPQIKFVKRKLSLKDLKHGESQVIKMLKDRPDMKEYITKGDALWMWIVRKFAGENLKDTIDWDAELSLGHDIEYVFPFDATRGSIRISDAFENLWAMAIFELNNLAFADIAENAYEKALEARLTKVDFVKQIALSEFKAIKKTSRFYKDIWKPWCKTKGLSTTDTCWNMWNGADCRSFVQWISRFDKDSEYPWQFYGDDYETYVRPYIKKVRKHGVFH